MNASFSEYRRAVQIFLDVFAENIDIRVETSDDEIVIHCSVNTPEFSISFPRETEDELLKEEDYLDYLEREGFLDDPE